MQQDFIIYKGSKFSYLRLGKGPGTVVCLHGYGENAAAYSFFEKYAGQDFTFISIDLPWHGNTEWENGIEFSTDDLENIVCCILRENGLWNNNPGPFITFLGFSLGGRMVLSLYERMPQLTEKILLLAPDGLKVNFWYWLSTQTWPGNRLFSFTMRHPGWFFGFLKLLHFFGMVNSSIFKFVNYYINNPEVRKLLYLRWTTLRKIKPDIRRIKELIQNHETRVFLVYGKYDRIILPARGKKFIRGIEKFAALDIIDSGHQVLHEKHVKQILPLLTGQKDNA